MSTFEFAIRSPVDLGLAVAEARTVHGRTQADLAGAVGVDRTYLARLENGHSTAMLDRLFALFGELGVTVHVTIPTERPVPSPWGG